MNRAGSSGLIIAGVALAFLLLIGAVWASDVSVATGLALTGGLILVGVGVLAMVMPRPERDQSDDQRDRMRQSTP